MNYKVCLGMALISLLFASTSIATENLLDIHTLAVENDPQFKSAQASRMAALESKFQSRALLLPSITLSTSATRSREDIKSSSSAFFVPDTFYSTATGYSVSLNQPIYHADYFIQMRQASATVGQAEAEFTVAQQELIVRVAERYFDVLAAIDNLEFAQAEKNAIDRQLEQTKQRFEVGLIAITDVHEAQAAFDLVNAQEIEAENLLASNREALAEITGRRHQQLAKLTVQMPLIAPEPTEIDKWSDTALNQNFELIAAEFSFNSAAEEINLQRSGHYPTLDITASHGTSDLEGGSFGARETDDSTIGIQLSLPLYQGGATNSRIREARYKFIQAKEDLEKQRRAILRKTRDAYLSTLAAIKRVKALNQAVISAQSAVDASEAGLEVGTRTTVDVLGVRRELFRALRNYARSRYDYVLNTLRLKQAAGILANTDLEQISSWMQ